MSNLNSAAGVLHSIYLRNGYEGSLKTVMEDIYTFVQSRLELTVLCGGQFPIYKGAHNARSIWILKLEDETIAKNN